MRTNGLVQAPLPHPAQIGDGGFGTRHDDHVGIGQVGGFPDPAHQHAGFTGQRLDVGGVGAIRGNRSTAIRSHWSPRGGLGVPSTR